jgi:hypothetical protein
MEKSLYVQFLTANIFFVCGCAQINPLSTAKRKRISEVPHLHAGLRMWPLRIYRYTRHRHRDLQLGMHSLISNEEFYLLGYNAV